MPDLTLSVLVSRTLLGLDDLEINDHTNYYVAPGSFGGQVTWQRATAGSPYMDDEVTVHRRRGKVTEAVNLEVRGANQAALMANVGAVVNAFNQDSFTISIMLQGQQIGYACEAADYQMAWTGPRFVARQCQIVFSVPRSPVPLVGQI